MKVNREFSPIRITLETEKDFYYIIRAVHLGWANATSKEQNDILEAAYKKLSEFNIDISLG